MQTSWIDEAIFYHIYPLGLCGAPPANDFHAPPVPRLEKLSGWIDHLRALQVNALYLGPVFESSAHGYDTADYFTVDRRLGTHQTLAGLVRALHGRGIRVVLDGVFNHVGRHFWAFRDVLNNREHSAYRDWFHHLDFTTRSPYGDPFAYEGWNGCCDLVKLNLANPQVKDHLFRAVQQWVQEFEIDGLRLDAADHIDPGFLGELAAFCRALRPDFWLMGEVVHGDYNRWANPGMLDSVTNYECYKGLYSSLVDQNYFEIAYALQRQSGAAGLYRDLKLYNFADNHDVDRVASRLNDPRHLYPLYCLLFSMPGVPSIYAGSEWGLQARRTRQDDRPLRPSLDLEALRRSSPQPDLPAAIARLARLRLDTPALRQGDYRPLHVAHQQLAFARTAGPASAIVMLNAAATPQALEFPVDLPHGARLVDRLNPGEHFRVEHGRLQVGQVWPYWGRVLVTE